MPWIPTNFIYRWTLVIIIFLVKRIPINCLTSKCQRPISKRVGRGRIKCTWFASRHVRQIRVRLRHLLRFRRPVFPRSRNVASHGGIFVALYVTQKCVREMTTGCVTPYAEIRSSCVYARRWLAKLVSALSFLENCCRPQYFLLQKTKNGCGFAHVE